MGGGGEMENLELTRHHTMKIHKIEFKNLKIYNFKKEIEVFGAGSHFVEQQEDAQC